MRPKELIKNTLDHFGYTLVPANRQAGEPIDVLDLAVRCCLAQAEKPFVLQIGANDGHRDDPLYKIITAYRLPALLVEPLPPVFEALQRNYAGQPDIRFENCAISYQDGQQNLYRVAEAPGVPSWALGMAGFDRKVLLKHKNQFPAIANHIETAPVRTMTMQSLLTRHGIRQVDLLQIDTEGFDFEIIKMSIHADFRPRILNYEYVHLSLADQEACRRYLASYGYRFLNVEKDTLAIHDV
jgi:FkbM family methyltransferase